MTIGVGTGQVGTVEVWSFAASNCKIGPAAIGSGAAAGMISRTRQGSVATLAAEVYRTIVAVTVKEPQMRLMRANLGVIADLAGAGESTGSPGYAARRCRQVSVSGIQAARCCAGCTMALDAGIVGVCSVPLWATARTMTLGIVTSTVGASNTAWQVIGIVNVSALGKSAGGQ